MNHHLNTAPLANNPNITIIGSGGTGGFVAESICRLMTGRHCSITLVDHDRVEPHNLFRQNFHREDIGKFKSKLLAERLANQFDRPISYSVTPFGLANEDMDHGLRIYNKALIIGCVDNAPARLAMDRCLAGNNQQWLIDAGNGANWGQVLIGNSNNPRTLLSRDDHMDQNAGIYKAPSPALQRPDILTAVPETPQDLDCAAAMDLTDQDPTINAMMAALVIQVTRKIIMGNCPFMGLYLDMEMGTVSPKYLSPEAVSRYSQDPDPPRSTTANPHPYNHHRQEELQDE